MNPKESVLATLEADGSRRWIYPELATGFYWARRRYTGFILIAVFTILPHLRWDGKPLVLLNITARRFTLFGYTFLPTDTLLLALLMVCGLIVIVSATALFGRVWCGWACPQTVYLEFVFRPLDRLFNGLSGKGGKPQQRLSAGKTVARFFVYLLLCMFLANTFLSYFVGTDTLARWVRQSPIHHPIPFLVMATTTGLMMFDFLYFREQLCLVACPYGRFQSVMLDRQSLIVTYDAPRGEPREKGKRLGPRTNRTLGDCVDCNACVRVCPTGIDIRKGLQMECIHCSQCIDACDDVMSKVHLPSGLIRYSNQQSIDGNATHWLRPRLVIYAIALTAALSAFVYVLLTKKDFDAQLFRGFGNSFSVGETGLIDNTLRLNLSNRTDDPRKYEVRLVSPSQAELRFIESDRIRLEAGSKFMFPILISAPYELFHDAACPFELEIKDDQGEQRILHYVLLGPYQKPSNAR